MASQGTSNGRGVDRRVDPALLPSGGGLSGAEPRSSGGRRRFRNVLLFAGLDDGPVPRRVLERALGLARANEARLTLIDVVREPELFREILPPQGLARVCRDRRRSLNRLAAVAQEWGVETETEVAAGRPFPEICREVQRCEHDLVMTEGGRDLRAGLIDRTTKHLMRKCPCAIWVARPHASNRHAGVLAAIDPDGTDSEKESLNRRIMEVAISMARLKTAEGVLERVDCSLLTVKPDGFASPI